MSYTSPTVAQFKAQFTRDFPFGTDPQVAVLDTDIGTAITLTDYNINQGLWPDQTSFNLGFLYLTAHYLTMNLRNSSQGLNGQFNFLQQNKSVSQVAEAFGIPQRILDNPLLSMLCKTNYGAMYLQLVLPQLTGQTFTVCGRTKP
jgi:hypothetical protein